MLLVLLLASLLGAAEPFPFGAPTAAATLYRYGQPYGPPPAQQQQQPLIALGSMPFPQLYSAVQSLQEDVQFGANQPQRFYQQQQPPRFAGLKTGHQQQVPVSQPPRLAPQFQQQQQYLALSGRPLEQQKEIGAEGKDFLASLQIIDTNGKPRSLQDFGIGGGPSGRAYEPELEEQLLSIFSTIQQDLKGAAYLPLNLGASKQPRQPEPIVNQPQQRQNQLGYSFKQPAQHQFQYLKPARALSKTKAQQEPIRSPVQALRAEAKQEQQQQQQQEKSIKSPVQVVRGEPEPVKQPLATTTVAPVQKVAPVVELERKPAAVETPVQVQAEQQQQQQQGFDDDLNDKNLEQVQLKEPIKQQQIEVVKQQAVRPIVAPANNQRYNIEAPMNGWVPLLQTFPMDQKAVLEPQFVEQIRGSEPELEQLKPISQLKEEKQTEEQLTKDLLEEQKVDSFGDNQQQQQQLEAPAKSIKRGRARKVASNQRQSPQRASNVYQQQTNLDIQQQQVRGNQQLEQFVPEQRQEEQLSAILEQQKEDMLQQQRDLAEVQKSQKQEAPSRQQLQELPQAPTTTAAPTTLRPAPVRLNDGVKGGRVKLITDKMRPSPIQRMRDQQLKAQKQQLEQSKRPRELTSAPKLAIAQRPQEELVEQVKEELPRQEEIPPVKVPARNPGEKKRIMPSFQEQQQLQIQKQIQQQQQQQLQEQQLPDQVPEFNEQSQQQKQEFDQQQDARQQQQQQEDLGQQREELSAQNQDQSGGEQRDELTSQQGQQQQEEQQQQQQKEELNQQQQQPLQEEQVQRKEEPALVQQKDEIDQQQREEPQQQQQQQQESFSEQPAIGQRDEVSQQQQQQQQKEELNQQREELDQQKEDQQTQRPAETASQQQEEENVQLKEEQPRQEQQQQSTDRLEEIPASQSSEVTTTSTTTTSTSTTGSTTTELNSSQQPTELSNQQEQKLEKKVEEPPVNQEQQQQQQKSELTTIKSSQLIDEEPAPIVTTTQRPPTRVRPAFFKKLDGDRFGKQKSALNQEKKEEAQPEVVVSTTQRPKARVVKGRRQQAQQQQQQQQQQLEGQKRGPTRNWSTYSSRPRSNENFQPQERANNEGILSANQLLNTYNPLQFEPERISSLNNRATESSPQNTNVNPSPSGESY